jgi:hypothetical protein
MNRNDFVAPDGQPWWLWETQIDSQTEEARRQLGMALGFSENEWYADLNRRTALYDVLESKGSNLLGDLDNLSDDTAKLQWVRDVTTLVAPPAHAQEHTTSPAPPAQTEAPPPAPAAAPAAKKSIFKAKEAETAPATNGDTQAPALDQAVQTVLADVTGAGLAGLASDLGVEADELEAIVNHPDFERDVREELARITAS